MSKRTARTLLASLIAAVLVLWAVPALAGKPTPPPPSNERIYASGNFSLQNGMITMLPDGSNKTPLPLGVNDVGYPSSLLHNGKRWFLSVQELSGEFYPDLTPRQEVYAVRDDGYKVRLTYDALLEPNVDVAPRWAPDDSQVTWVARLWEVEPQQPVSGGIYSAQVVFDGIDNLPRLFSPPSPIVPQDLDPTLDFWPLAKNLDWAPDMHALVYGIWVVDHTARQHELHIAVPGSSDELLCEDCDNPDWGPAKILFSSNQGIESILATGSGRTLLISVSSQTMLGWPTYSPNGAWFAYQQVSLRLNQNVYAVYKARSDGTSPTNLTKGYNYALPWGWRIMQ